MTVNFATICSVINIANICSIIKIVFSNPPKSAITFVQTNLNVLQTQKQVGQRKLENGSTVIVSMIIDDAHCP